MSNSAGYLASVINPKSRRVILATVKQIVEKMIGLGNFQHIACRGFSGSLIAPTIADAFDKSILAVRKTTGDCHSSYGIEAPSEQAIGAGYIIIDDLIATGKTVHAICDEVFSRFPDMTCKGIVLYDNENRETDDFIDHRGVSIPVYNFTTILAESGAMEVRTANEKLQKYIDNSKPY